jgi:hypothetical protein
LKSRTYSCFVFLLHNRLGRRYIRTREHSRFYDLDGLGWVACWLHSGLAFVVDLLVLLSIYVMIPCWTFACGCADEVGLGIVYCLTDVKGDDEGKDGNENLLVG